MIIHPEAVPLESQPERSLVLRRVINAEAHSPDISVTWVSIDGHHDRIVNHESDRAYYVIEGTARFQLGDAAPQTITAGDFVFIPRSTPYEFDGTMQYLVINGPAFRPASDQVLPSTFP